VAAFLDRWNRTTITGQPASRTPPPSLRAPTGLHRSDLGAAGEAFLTANEAAIAAGYSSPFAQLMSDVQAAKGNVDAAAKEAGICARVKVELDQQAILSRNAFKASLNINNSGASPLVGLAVTLDIRDQAGNVATPLFAISPPVLTVSVTSRGQPVAAGAQLAIWTLVPSDGPAHRTRHHRRGTLSYVLDNVPVRSSASPSPIECCPTEPARGTSVRDVFADDPFTLEIRPSSRSPSADDDQRRRRNRNNVGSPARGRIVENEGNSDPHQPDRTQVNALPVTPSRRRSRNIDPNATGVAEVALVSSLQGSSSNTRPATNTSTRWASRRRR
jgi:hypothetical protein